MRSLGKPAAEAASNAVERSGTQVNKAFGFASKSWCRSSAAEYAALAGETMPPSEWVAHARGNVSI